MEKPAPSRQPITASCWRRVTAPGVVRDSMSPTAQRWRASAARIEIARCRSDFFQSSPLGSSISAKTRSTMPSSRASLPATWLYSDIASTPSAWPSLRMLSDSIPFSSAKATAARSTASRVTPFRGPGTLTTLRRKSITYTVSLTPSEGAMTTHQLPTTTMTSLVQDRYGTTPGDVLRIAEVARPAPGDGEVLVRVRAASIDRGTWHLMAGLAYPIRLVFGLRRPRFANPGRNLAGTVEAVGAGVTEFRAGDEVFGVAAGNGTFAEYALARPDRLSAKPANLSFEEAATVPVSGSTALQAVRDHARVRAGESVLVLGASGGVGSFAVQIAKAFGAEVTGVASTAKLDLVRSLGADHVVDHTTDDVTAGAARYDVVLDIGGNTPVRRLRRVLTPRGTLVIVGGEGGGRWLGMGRQLRAAALSPFVRQRLGFFVNRENAADLVVLAGLIESGQVTPAVDRTFPLAEAAAAVTYLAEGRARGKVVVEVSR